MVLQLQMIKKRVIPVLKKNQVVKAGIFGSYARGDQKNNSDVDFLIKFKGRKNLLDLVKLKRELKEALNKDVDVITYRSIYPPLKKTVLIEEVKIL